MRYTRFLLSGAIFFLISPLLVIGMDPTTSGRIINTFKKEQYAILFENLPFDQSGATEIYEKEYIMHGLDGLKKRLAEATEVYQEKRAVTLQKRASLEDALMMIENSIADTVSDIRKTEKSINEKNSVIGEYQDLSIDIAIRIKKTRSTILRYLANIYSEGNLIYDETNEINIFQTLIMTDKNTDELSNDIIYKSLISILGHKFVQDYRSLLKDYRLIQLQIKEEVALLEKDQRVLATQKSNLLSQREYREQLLEATKGQEALYEKYIESQMETQRRIEDSWKNAADSYTISLENLLAKNGCEKDKKTGEDIEKCGNILSFYRNERALKKISFATGVTNVMDWPVKNPSALSAFFKDPSYYRVLGTQHDAIDIPVDQGTDIIAPMDGYVQYILPPVSGGYSYMAIKHPDGYVTVYGHLSEVLVYPYQFVTKGDRIARSGGAVGTPGAGPMTSGAHLHFEVWKNQEPLDPLRVLDISLLDYENIPSRYQDKYIADIVARAGSGVDTSEYDRRFIIQGDTETARQNYLLRTYATPDFQDYDTWIDIALDARIDPSFLICVGLAETTLGNNLKTSYNIGNVGNTDSGDVVSFSSPREGIAWMASTFNNRYLSHYNYVSELSRWGNPEGTIYASSNANWHNNIIRCISSLKGRFVEDKYDFRIQKE